MTIGIVPNGIKIELNGVQNGIPVVNRFYVTAAAAPTGTDMNNALNKALDFWNSYKGFQHPSFTLANITVTDVHIANGTQMIAQLVSNNVGIGTGVALAANAAMCASLRTANTGRSFRGRFYIGGLAGVVQQDAQNFTTSSVAQIPGVFADFIDALATVGLKLVVVSNYANKVVRVVALASEIISIICDTKIDSQRRRTAN